MLSTTFSDARGEAPLMSRVVSSPPASQSLQSSPASLAPAPADVYSRGRSRSVAGCQPSSIVGARPVIGSRDLWRTSERASTPPNGDLISWWRDLLHLPSDEAEDSDKRRQKPAPVEEVDDYMRTRDVRLPLLSLQTSLAVPHALPRVSTTLVMPPFPPSLRERPRRQR